MSSFRIGTSTSIFLHVHAKVAHPTMEQARGDLAWYLLGVKQFRAIPTKQDLGTT